MRRKERELTDPKVIRDFIEKSEVCRIGMYDGNYPYVLPFNFTDNWDRQTVFLHSAKSGKKIETLRSHPEVCFELDSAMGVIREENPCDAGYAYISLIGYGTARFCTELDEKKWVLRSLTRKYLEMDHHFSDDETNRVEIIKITLTDVICKTCLR